VFWWNLEDCLFRTIVRKIVEDITKVMKLILSLKVMELIYSIKKMCTTSLSKRYPYLPISSPYIIKAHGDGCNWLPAKVITHTPAPTTGLIPYI